MKPYKRLTIICGIISLVSFVVCLCLQYLIVCNEADFWVNVCLAIFGSSLLTLLSSLVSYFHEKRVTLENFMYHCKQLLQVLNKYQASMSLSEKMKFFLAYHDIDKSGWDAAYGNMDFLLDRFTGNRNYIYENLYRPIILFNQAVGQHVWHFRWYFDGSGKNNDVMEIFVAQLEQHLLYRSEQSIPKDYDKNGNVVSFAEMTSIESKLVREILQELNGRYYEIMYGKKKSLGPKLAGKSDKH